MFNLSVPQVLHLQNRTDNNRGTFRASGRIKTVPSREEPRAWGGPQQMTAGMALCPGIGPTRMGGRGKALQRLKVNGHHGGHK